MAKTNGDNRFELLHQEFIQKATSPNLNLIKSYSIDNSTINLSLIKGVSPKGDPEPFQLNVGLTHRKFTDDSSSPSKEQSLHFIDFLQNESLEMVKEYCAKTKDIRIAFNNDFFVLNLKVNIHIISSNKVNTFIRMFKLKKNSWIQTYPMETFF